MPDCHHHHHNHHHHHHVFWKCSFLPPYTRVEHLPIWGLSTYPWILPIQAVNQALSCHHPHFFPSLPIPPLTFRPCHLHLSTGRYPTSTLLRSKCPNHLNLPCLTTDCTNPHCVPYPSATPRTFISPSSVPSSPDFSDLLFSSPRFQSYMSMHSGHKPCIMYIFPFIQYDAPQAVRIGDNSLNLAQAHLALALAAFSTPSPAPSVSHQVCRPNSRTWKHIPTSHWAQSHPFSAKLTERGHSHPPSTSCNGNQHYSSTFLKCHYIFCEPT